MIVNRCGSNDVPSWMVKSVVGDDVNARSSAITKIDDSNEVSVMRSLEKAATVDGKVYCDASIDAQSMAKLTEMAEIAGVKVVQTNATTASAFKSVADYTPAAKKKIEEVDITKAGFADPASFKKSKEWDATAATRQKVLDETPSDKHGVRSIRGGDDYNVSPNMNPRTGEASIASPEVKGASDTSESTKDMTKRLSSERKEAISFNQKTWESETMSGVEADKLPRAGISGYAADTNRNSKAPVGQFSILHDKSSPEDGRLGSAEAIRSENAAKKASIQRETSADRDWDTETSSVPSVMSDVFYETLKKAMGK